MTRPSATRVEGLVPSVVARWLRDARLCIVGPMRNVFSFLLLVGVLIVTVAIAPSGFAAPAPADAASDPRAPSEDAGPLLARNDDVAFVRRRGVDLYQRHEASLLALEAAAEVGLAENDPEGWITVRDGEEIVVRFVAACAEGPCAVVDVRVGPERLTAEPLYPPPILVDEQADAWQVQRRVLERQTATCAVPYNAIAIPTPAADAPWTVYLVAQPREEDVIALGGHARVLVDPVADAIVRAEDLSPGCLLVRRNAEQSSVALTYGQSPIPAETHVMTSLLEQIVLFVGTVDGIWQVNGDQIEQKQPQDVPGFAPAP